MSDSIQNRQTTDTIKHAFAFVEAEKDENEKTITKFLNTKCSICFDTITERENIAVLTMCGHYSCKKCFYDYLNHVPQQSCCFTCRLDFDINTTISTIDWGICSIIEYISNYEIMICDNEDYEDYHGFPTRQITCCLNTPLRRQVTGLGSISAMTYENHDTTIILPAIPRIINNISNNLDNDLLSSNEAYFYRTPLLEIMDQHGIKKYIGTVVMIAPYQELKEQLPIDVVIIIDRSGSMAGSMIDNAKKSIEELIEKSRNKHSIRITLISFDHIAEHEFALQNITDQNFDSIIAKVKALYARGSTNYDSAFTMLKDVIPSDNQVQTCVFFLTDGIPDHSPNLTFLQEFIYTQHPTLIFHIVSIGNNVEAESNLIPLHCGRDAELAKYTHLAESTDITFFNDQVGDAVGIYAEHICFSFGSQIKPIYSKQVLNEDGSAIVNMSVLSRNSTIQIAFMMNDNTSYEDSTDLSVSYILDGTSLSKTAILDKDNIIGDTMKHFAVFRYYTLELNTIIDSKKNIETKKTLLNNILSITNIELFGDFYDDFKNNLEIHIKNLDITTIEYKNLIAQSNVRQNSVKRQTSENLSRGISSRYTPFSDHTIDEDNEMIEEENM
jgi:uncharacterized protein YegL